MHALPQPVKLYYIGPMFRRERPQKGRYRQFYQIGAEVLEALQQGQQDSAKNTSKDAAVDAEVIEMVMAFFAKLELDGVQLEINSIGCRECRPKYVELLRSELLKVKDNLGPDSQRRIETNPLRVLDSKLESEQEIIGGLPRIGDHLCAACAEQYAEVKRQLGVREVPFKENWRLVRGLDYYMRTTFEITARGLARRMQCAAVGVMMGWWKSWVGCRRKNWICDWRRPIDAFAAGSGEGRRGEGSRRVRSLDGRKGSGRGDTSGADAAARQDCAWSCRPQNKSLAKRWGKPIRLARGTH